MSWDSYIDSVVAHGRVNNVENVDRVAIIQLGSGAKWTSETHPQVLRLKDEEAKTIGAICKSRDMTSFTTGGVWIEGIKYNFLREDEGPIYAKKLDHGHITIENSNQAVVIGHCPEGKTPGACNKAVHNIVEYLKEQNM